MNLPTINLSQQRGGKLYQQQMAVSPEWAEFDNNGYLLYIVRTMDRDMLDYAGFVLPDREWTAR